MVLHESVQSVASDQQPELQRELPGLETVKHWLSRTVTAVPESTSSASMLGTSLGLQCGILFTFSDGHHDTDTV